MIKINKSLEESDIPESLRNIDIKILSNDYDNSNDKKYKAEDTKKALKKIYKEKCAFCEQKLFNIPNKDNQSTIEHYRPKSKYPWLAFSWDNLLSCCRKCNSNKKDKFPTNNKEIKYSPSFLKKKHSSTILYNRIEKPEIIHLDYENIINKLIFDKYGNMSSKEDRITKTISTFDLNINKFRE